MIGTSTARFARATRGHWGIENSLHWNLEISFREGEGRVRDPLARENLAPANLQSRHPSSVLKEFRERIINNKIKNLNKLDKEACEWVLLRGGLRVA